MNRDRTEDILRTSLALFLEKGYHGATTREVCRRLGVSSGLFFHYFSSKLEVYEQLVASAVRAIALDPDAGKADPLGHLQRRVEDVLALLAADRRHAAMFVFMGQVQRNPGISPVADALVRDQDVVRASVPLIEAGQASGVIRPGSALALSAALWCAVQGFAEELAVHPDLPLPEADWYLDLVRAPAAAISPA